MACPICRGEKPHPMCDQDLDIPPDWNANDGEHFLQGVILAVILSAPLWVVIAALAGWL